MNSAPRFLRKFIPTMFQNKSALRSHSTRSVFQTVATETSQMYRLAVIGLLLLSAAALLVTLWIMLDFVREQAIVDGLVQRLPGDAQETARDLAGELKWQFRLTILVVLNVVVTGIAVVLLWRAYHASQASLRDFKALAANVLSSMDQAVVTTDRDGLITSINQRGLELLELGSDCVGQSIQDLPSIPLEAYRQQWLQERSSAMVQDYAVPHQGNTRTLRAFCQMLTNHQGDEIGNVLQVRDVTERRLIEERMRRMERYMGLGSLAVGLHHEIKNPLAALSLHVQLLEEQLETDGTSDENKKMLGVIRTEVARIGGVLESFRDFAAIGHLDTKPVNLNELVQQPLALIRPQAETQSIGIQFQPCDLLQPLAADPRRLEQVLLNLLVNAMEAMPQGGTLSVATRQDEYHASLEISDTGCGIPLNLQDKIMDPYFTTKSSGTGLGLAICDKIMRQHLGTLDFRSSPQGSTFRLTLPRSR